MRKGVTLIEIIFTIAIAGILAVGTSEILKNVATQTQRAKDMTVLSLDTQSALDQIAGLLYYRVPNSAIGYDGNGSYQSVMRISSAETILEWFGTFHEARILGKLSNFIDMDASNHQTSSINSPDTDFTFINTNLSNKFLGKNIAKIGIIFAGSFDKGVDDGNSSFGWHGSSTSQVYKASGGTDENLTLGGTTQPTYIYEKYYLADSAYAVARSVDVDKDASCMQNLKIGDDNNTLLLFYDYRPWDGETFCADKHGAKKVGNVTILAQDITGFRAEPINFSIRVSIDAKRKVKGTKTFVHVGKQKVVF